MTKIPLHGTNYVLVCATDPFRPKPLHNWLSVVRVERIDEPQEGEMNLMLHPHYTSTYCIHGDHEHCRKTCKTCKAPCRCECHKMSYSEREDPRFWLPKCRELQAEHDSIQQRLTVTEKEEVASLNKIVNDTMKYEPLAQHITDAITGDRTISNLMQRGALSLDTYEDATKKAVLEALVKEDPLK